MNHISNLGSQLVRVLESRAVQLPAALVFLVGALLAVLHWFAGVAQHKGSLAVLAVVLMALGTIVMLISLRTRPLAQPELLPPPSSREEKPKPRVIDLDAVLRANPQLAQPGSLNVALEAAKKRVEHNQRATAKALLDLSKEGRALRDKLDVPVYARSIEEWNTSGGTLDASVRAWATKTRNYIGNNANFYLRNFDDGPDLDPQPLVGIMASRSKLLKFTDAKLANLDKIMAGLLSQAS